MQTDKVYILMNEPALDSWVNERLENGIKYSEHKETLGAITRTVRLVDENNVTFELAWKLIGRTTYVQALLPQICKALTQHIDVLTNVYGCEGFFFGVKIPHINSDNELETAYSMYVENIEPEDFLAFQLNYQEHEQ